MDYRFTSRTNCTDNSFFNHIKSYEMYLLLQNDRSNGVKFISQITVTLETPRDMLFMY